MGNKLLQMMSHVNLKQDNWNLGQLGKCRCINLIDARGDNEFQFEFPFNASMVYGNKEYKNNPANVPMLGIMEM